MYSDFFTYSARCQFNLNEVYFQTTEDRHCIARERSNYSEKPVHSLAF